MNEPLPSADPDRTNLREPSAEPVTTDATADATDPRRAGWMDELRDMMADAPPDVPGYRVIEEIAKGGMGRVYAAVDLTLDREVAIKTLLPGSNAERFVTESKITAKLPHPNIPPVHELGQLADGSPFLVMKLIRGQTLSALLKARPSPSADLPRWVQVFEQIAQAVGFAHSRHVIHRDLKPLNVMVGEFGEVQVMDWGLARIAAPLSPGGEGLGVRGTGDAITSAANADLTAAGAIMGTPAYMAPEQARGEQLDARADVFALGATLATILTGQPAFVGRTLNETIQKAAVADLYDVFARLDSCGADADLIAVAKRCLSANFAARPADGRAVADEVGAYRSGVEARLRQAETEHAKAIVREGEQRKRRRVVQWSAVGIAVVLLLGIAGTTTGLVLATDRATREEQAKFAETRAKEEETKAKDAEAAERGRAERALGQEKLARTDAETNLSYAQTGNSILGSVFLNLDPKAKYGTLAELRNALKANLKTAVRQLDESAIGDPLVVADMQMKLARALIGLGEAKSAAELYGKAHATRSAQLGPDHPDTLVSLADLATGHHALGELKRAIDVWEEAIGLYKKKFGPDDARTLAVMNNLAIGYADAGKPESARSLHEQALKVRTGSLGRDHPDTIESMNNLASLYGATGEYQKALRLYEELLPLCRAVHGEKSLFTATVASNHANLHTNMGRPDLARPLYERILPVFQAALGDDHADTARVMGSLARVLVKTGDGSKAVPLLEQVVRTLRAKLGPDHHDTHTGMANLAEGYHATNQFEKAASLFEQVLQLRKANLGPTHPDTLVAMSNLSVVLLDSGQPDRAIPILKDAFPLFEDKYGPDHPHTLRCLSNLASGYQDAGQPDRAVPLLERMHQLLTTKVGADHPDTIRCLSRLGTVYARSGAGEKAVVALSQLAAIARKRSPKDDPQLAGLLAQIGLLLLNCDQFAAAEEVLREALAIHEKKEPDAWGRFNTQSLLGAALRGQKKYADAEPLLLKGYVGMKEREKAIPPSASTRIPEALDRLVELYTATDKFEEAKKYRELRAKYPAAKPVGPPKKEVLPPPRADK